MYQQNPIALIEHVRLQREQMAREVQRMQAASQCPPQLSLGQRLLCALGALLVNAGSAMQRMGGRRSAQPVSI